MDATQVALRSPSMPGMDTRFLCPDCGHAHADPADAVLGYRVRCLDCQIEVDLAVELTLIARPEAA